MNANEELIRERKFIWLLCVAAAIHVFIFSAAFPFFNNVDEAFHFDLILKYSHGEAPRRIEPISADAASFLALMNCHAYFLRPDQYPGGVFPPPAWTLPADQSAQDIAARSANWQTQENYEVSQAPLYYTLAAIWWHIGGWIGFHDGRLVYWLRFLNIGLISALVWLAYLTARLVFPVNSFARMAVPALLAFMPQTAFYSLGNDAISALCFGIAFLFLLKWLASDVPSPKIGAAMGLAFAATLLAKINNAPLLAIAAAALLFKAVCDNRRGKLQAAAAAIATFFACALPMIVLWMAWCRLNFGDYTGSALKTQFLGWTLKPFSQWWPHPIFTPHGFWTYLSRQLGTLWQGEFLWHHQPLELPGSDIVYSVLSLALILTALPAILPQHSDSPALVRWTIVLGAGCFAAELFFFILISIMYDFHNSPAPSRSYPYFTAGRLLLGAVIPFLLVLAFGMDRLLKGLGMWAKFLTLAACLGIMLTVEVASDWPALFSEYNWFHLP
ncbi:MAG TPA: DUF2142 domain-containing protein [Verrucomicrobiae bacterium]|nr:DUF2142 domain-containing protein [Verrucomicrobiae bacterium]